MTIKRFPILFCLLGLWLGLSLDLAVVLAASKININTATVEGLSEVPGIGPKTAAKIIAYRKAHGPFKQIEDILNVPGIGPGKFEKMKSYLTVSGGVSSPSKSSDTAALKDSKSAESSAEAADEAAKGELLPPEMIPRTCWSCTNKFYVHLSLLEGWCPYCGTRWKIRQSGTKQ